jgi:hypothetical protein
VTRVQVREVEIGREHGSQATIRAMRKNLIPFATSLLLAGAAGTASAGGSAGTVGVGFEQMIYGPGGASVVYDAGKFHAGGFFGFSQNQFAFGGDKSDVDFGGQFFFHAHSTSSSDLGVGGGIGMRFENHTDPNQNDDQILYLELGAQIRAFIATNVALSATLGFEIATADGDGVAFDGAPVGAFGVHYYFF